MSNTPFRPREDTISPHTHAIDKVHKKRIIFCGPLAVRVQLANSAAFAFVPYGKCDLGALHAHLGGVDAIIVHSSIDNMEEFARWSKIELPELPCFVLCRDHEQLSLSHLGSQLIAVNDKTPLTEIEDRIARAFFLFPLIQRQSLRRIMAALKRIPTEATSHQRIVRELQKPDFQLEYIA